MPDHRGQIDPVYLEVGQLIRKARKQTGNGRGGFTQVELGDLVSLSRESIANIESGRQQVLLHHVMRIAKALRVDIATLLPDESAKSPSLEAELQSKSTNERDFVNKAIRD